MSEEPQEGFSWKKYLSGIFNPLNFAKYSAFILQFAIVIVICIFLGKGFLSVKNWLFPKKGTIPSVGQICDNEKVEVSTDKKTKIGLNIF